MNAAASGLWKNPGEATMSRRVQSNQTKQTMNDKMTSVDWTKTDAEIGRQVGLSRFRISQIRIVETGLTSKGREINPPEGFVAERSVEKTARKYKVCNHIARRWHKTLNLICSIGKMPPDFVPVTKIHQQATAEKYGVSAPTANRWIREYQEQNQTNEQP